MVRNRQKLAAIDSNLRFFASVEAYEPIKKNGRKTEWVLELQVHLQGLLFRCKNLLATERPQKNHFGALRIVGFCIYQKSYIYDCA